MRARLHVAVAALIALAVAGCGRGLPSQPGEIIRLPCPDKLVTLDAAERPAPPDWGSDPVAAAAIYGEKAETYMDERDRQAEAREEQVRECHRRADAR